MRIDVFKKNGCAEFTIINCFAVSTRVFCLLNNLIFVYIRIIYIQEGNARNRQKIKEIIEPILLTKTSN